MYLVTIRSFDLKTLFHMYNLNKIVEVFLVGPWKSKILLSQMKVRAIHGVQSWLGSQE